MQSLIRKGIQQRYDYELTLVLYGRKRTVLSEKAQKMVAIIRRTIQTWYDRELGVVKIGMLSFEGKQLLYRFKACWKEKISVEIAKERLKREDGITIMQPEDIFEQTKNVECGPLSLMQDEKAEVDQEVINDLQVQKLDTETQAEVKKEIEELQPKVDNNIQMLLDRLQQAIHSRLVVPKKEEEG